MVIFWGFTVCGGFIRQYGTFYQNNNNFNKNFFSVYVLFNYKINKLYRNIKRTVKNTSLIIIILIINSSFFN